MAVRITRRNPHTGREERPWRNRDGLFVLGDPAHGAQRHHAKFAVKAATLEEVAGMVRRGFLLRMSDGETPPSLIAADALTLEEVETADEAGLSVQSAPTPPFGREEMLEELRRVLLVIGSQVALAGSHEAACTFMGFDSDTGYEPTDAERVDLTRFAATAFMGRAYDYAFQVGEYWLFGDAEAQEVDEFVRGASRQDSSGNSSPLTNEDGKCRVTADTAFGRWKLEQGFGLTVRDLALLAQMKEGAVRNSLSRDRVAIRDREVDAEVARAWLGQRRDFVATRTEEGSRERWRSSTRFSLGHDDFAAAMAKVMRNYPMTPAELASKATVPAGFVETLLAGRPGTDLEALQRVAAALELEPADFAAAAIRAALRPSG